MEQVGGRFWWFLVTMAPEQCLLLNLWKYFYSYNLESTGIDQTQNSVKELSPGPETFFLSV